MAMRTRKIILGVDVSQDWLDCCVYGNDDVVQIANERHAIDAWLKAYGHGDVALAIEATNTYHELVVERARRFGLAVYLISGYQLKHYAKSLNVRMRTDRVDAQLLARYLEREIDDLGSFAYSTTLIIRHPLFHVSDERIHKFLGCLFFAFRCRAESRKKGVTLGPVFFLTGASVFPIFAVLQQRLTAGDWKFWLFQS